MRDKCFKCLFRRATSGGVASYMSICSVASEGKTALFKYGDKILDRRGPDPNDCLLFRRRKPGMGISEISAEDYQRSVIRALDEYKIYEENKIDRIQK